MDDLRAAQRALDDAKRALHDAVATARTAGRTWQEIGDALAMSRQAAFKRFGTPTDPVTGETLARRTASEIADLTETTFRLIATGDHDALHRMMTPETAAALTSDVIGETWRSALAAVGALERFEATHVELPDGSEVEPGDEVLGITIGATRIVCEAGESVGRVAFDDGVRIIGVLIVPPDHGDLPF